MARLVLINGVPGAGKSTVAHLLARDKPLDLALDVDALKHSLGGWELDMTTSGYHARRLALALADEQLASGHDIYLGQFLARTEFIEQLQAAAQHRGAEFVEFILTVDETTLRNRLANRSGHPDRAEHLVNGSLVSVDDIPDLIRAISELATRRPAAHQVDARGTVDDTLSGVRRKLAVGA